MTPVELMETQIRAKILPGYVVHHLDGNPENCSLKNLLLCTEVQAAGLEATRKALQENLPDAADPVTPHMTGVLADIIVDLQLLAQDVHRLTRALESPEALAKRIMQQAETLLLESNRNAENAVHLSNGTAAQSLSNDIQSMIL